VVIVYSSFSCFFSEALTEKLVEKTVEKLADGQEKVIRS
jgi:hypothetical protein